MKKISKPGFITISIIIAIIMSMATPAFAASKDVSKQITAYFTSGGKSISVYINDTQIIPRDGNGNQVYPFTVDGTTYLPVRAVASALGKTVTWDGTTASVKIDDSATATTTQNNDTSKPNTDSVKQLTAYYTSGGKTISIYINGTKLTPKDGNGKIVDPFTVDGTTYLPVRAISEALGKDVKWDGSTASVKITDKADEKLNLPKTVNDANAKLTTTVDANGNRTDSLDYKFTLDKNAVGEWEYFNWYDYDDITNQFDPNGTSDLKHSSLQTVSLYDDGSMVLHYLDNGNKSNDEGLHWTKNYLVDLTYGDKTIPAYAISTIGGKTFMVVEGKSGDYTRKGVILYYDVFVKTSNAPATASPIKVIRDNNGVIHESMDYKFVTDKDAIGQWTAINFVASPDEFDGKDTTKQSFIETSIRNFYDNGKEAHYANKANGAAMTQWTKGYIWGSDDTICEYVIKQLNGKTFMFVQWKTGDYTVRGQKPNYMVYMKTSNTPDPDFVK